MKNGSFQFTNSVYFFYSYRHIFSTVIGKYNIIRCIFNIQYKHECMYFNDV